MEVNIKEKDGVAVKYRTGRLNAKQQYQLARRLLPVRIAKMQGLAAMAAKIGVKAPVEGAEQEETQAPMLTGDDLIAGFMPMAEMLSKMSDADVDYIITSSLAVCEKQVGASWAAVQAPNGRLMFDDLDMASMMKLVNAVVEENCGGFFEDPSEILGV